MGRRKGASCARCGGTKRTRGRRKPQNQWGTSQGAPVGVCVDCRDPVCLTHAVEAPEDGGYRCVKCERERKKGAA